MSRNNLLFYRILYTGAGGGIMLCVIEINKVTNAVVLHSLVTISESKLIPYCADYS